MAGANSEHDLPTEHAPLPFGTFHSLGGLIGEICAEQVGMNSAIPAIAGIQNRLGMLFEDLRLVRTSTPPEFATVSM
jgi:hypothetical protein